jgi:hypothetical protein
VEQTCVLKEHTVATSLIVSFHVLAVRLIHGFFIASHSFQGIRNATLTANSSDFYSSSLTDLSVCRDSLRYMYIHTFDTTYFMLYVCVHVYGFGTVILLCATQMNFSASGVLTHAMHRSSLYHWIMYGLWNSNGIIT